MSFELNRRTMMKAGVPTVPGSEDIIEDVDEAMRSAAEIGFPVMIKASAGGGGKGMRVVQSADELETAYRTASSEAG